MATITLSATLRTEYENLFNSCIVSSAKARIVETIVGKLIANKNRYLLVSEPLGIPWYFVAVIHNMESSLRFDKHLHNGDPLTARTVQVPSGRPKNGQPPFTWEESARDAISIKELNSRTDWSLSGLLYQLERYNGFGYRNHHPAVKSPYLWSFSNQYTSGKYIGDGEWSDIAVSDQCGSAVLLRRMAETGIIEFPDQPAPAPDSRPIVVGYSTKKSSDPAVVKKAEDLQKWLNTFPGIFIKVDGVPGNNTSKAFKDVTGAYLPGDPKLLFPG